MTDHTELYDRIDMLRRRIGDLRTEHSIARIHIDKLRGQVRRRDKALELCDFGLREALRCGPQYEFERKVAHKAIEAIAAIREAREVSDG